MATGVGTPAITNPRPNDWRGLQNAISAIIQRFQNDEALLATANSTAAATANSTTGNLNSILSALQLLQIEVNALQNAQITDIESFVAGEAIAAGQVIVPLTANTVGIADPNDTARIFGVLGIATGPAAPASAVLVQRSGVYTFTGSSMGFEVGRAVYCDTLGGVTQNPSYDAVTIPLGVAVTSNAVFVDPDSPALLQPTFSSGFENPYEDYLPATYALIKTLGSLESLIAALSYQSGADANMQVPVLNDFGVAVRVSAGDIAALGGGTGGGVTNVTANNGVASSGGTTPNITLNLASLPVQSGIDRFAEIPALIGGMDVLVTAEDIASLAQAGYIRGAGWGQRHVSHQRFSNERRHHNGYRIRHDRFGNGARCRRPRLLRHRCVENDLRGGTADGCEFDHGIRQTDDKRGAKVTGHDTLRVDEKRGRW